MRFHSMCEYYQEAATNDSFGILTFLSATDPMNLPANIIHVPLEAIMPDLLTPVLLLLLFLSRTTSAVSLDGSGLRCARSQRLFRSLNLFSRLPSSRSRRSFNTLYRVSTL